MRTLRLSSALTSLLPSLLTLTLLVACGGDDPPDPGASAGGSAGSAGAQGGKAGSAQAGQGGKAGINQGGFAQSGASGQGGSSQGGSSQAGSGGSPTAGQGGSSAGSSSGSGGSAQAGAGASAGQGGSEAAGQGGSPQAGSGGSPQAGSGGSSQAGSGGSPQAGSGGSPQAGSGGSAQAGSGGSSQAGSGGSQAGGGGVAGGGSSQAGSGGAGQAGAGGSGAGGSAGSGPAGPSFAPLPRTTQCVHTGSGRDIQVGNPSVESGPKITQVATIGEVDWNNLAPGDTVRIFWRQQPYREKILLRASGTAEQPIRVCGVRGPSGQRPHLLGENATTRPDLDYGSLSNGMEDLAIVAIWHRSYEKRAEHIHVEGLKITGTIGAPGYATEGDQQGDERSYTATDGSVRRYRHSAACLRIQEGRAIELRDNEIAECGNGLFVLSRVPEVQMTREIVVEGNYFHDNGLLNEEGVHTAYIQGVDIVVQGNHFGPTRPGAMGNTLKMRVAGDTIRYNLFERGARVLDLVEVEDHAQLVIPELYEQFKQDDPAEVSPEDDARVAHAWAMYQRTYVYGNILDNRSPDAATNLVHYSFDNTQNDRRRGTLFFFHNTVVQRSDFDDVAIFRLVDQGPYWGNGGPAVNHNTYDGYATVRALNNVLVAVPGTVGAKRSFFEWTRYRADKLVLGKNWIFSDWQQGIPGWGQQFPGFGNAQVSNPQNVYPGGNDTHHVSGMELLVTGAAPPIDLTSYQPLPAIVGQAGPLPDDLPAQHLPTLQRDPISGSLLPRPTASTLGALE